MIPFISDVLKKHIARDKERLLLLTQPWVGTRKTSTAFFLGDRNALSDSGALRTYLDAHWRGGALRTLKDDCFTLNPNYHLHLVGTLPGLELGVESQRHPGPTPEPEDFLRPSLS